MEEMTSEIDKTEKTGTRDKHKAEPNRPKQQDSRQDRQGETGRHTVTQSMGTQTNYTIRKGEEEGFGVLGERGKEEEDISGDRISKLWFWKKKKKKKKNNDWKWV